MYEETQIFESLSMQVVSDVGSGLDPGPKIFSISGPRWRIQYNVIKDGCLA
jgi:hypothetical protein